MERPQVYGWEASPYTAKVFAYLNYKQLDPKLVPPTLWQLQYKIKPKVGQIVMPVVFDAKNILQDSSAIIDHYEQLHPERPVIPNAPLHKISTYLLELLADDWLILGALHFRWHYKENHASTYQDFGKNALPKCPSWAQRFIGKKMGKRIARYLPILGITPDMQIPIESNVQYILESLDKHLSQHEFIFGTCPSLADFAFYGPIHAHLYRDPFPNKMLAPYPFILKWLSRLHDQGNFIRGSWQNAESLPATLIPLFQVWKDNHLPLLKESIESFKNWCIHHPQEHLLPRSFGKAQLTIDGISANRVNLSYVLWMWQRIQNVYKELNDVEQRHVNVFLNQLDILALIQTPLPRIISLKDCRLHISPC